jgi:hypothetical protein
MGLGIGPAAIFKIPSSIAGGRISTAIDFSPREFFDGSVGSGALLPFRRPYVVAVD